MALSIGSGKRFPPQNNRNPLPLPKKSLSLKVSLILLERQQTEEGGRWMD